MSEKEISLRNCKFAFRCTRTWKSLHPSDNESVRFCDDCARDVHLCRTDRELLEAVQADKCVAIVLKKPGEPFQDKRREFFGVGTLAKSPYLTVIKGGKGN